MEEKLNELKNVIQQAREQIKKVLIGQDLVVDLVLITILTRQHALIEGVPGIGKTILVRTLAKVLGCDFNRIQFTPDLMPSDITGTNIFNLESRRFELVKGPVFTSFLLADEINRAPAKTQSALLQAMQERQVTIDGNNFELPAAFAVFATQNPVEFEGTYPLPEAQKDRFMLKIKMNYPSSSEELELAQRMLGDDAPENVLKMSQVASVLSLEKLENLRPGLQQITLRDELLSFIVELVRLTRNFESILVGAGPRATQALVLASRAWAALDERDFVTPDDIKTMAPYVLEHRLIIRPEFEIEGLALSEIVENLLMEVSVPR